MTITPDDIFMEIDKELSQLLGLSWLGEIGNEEYFKLREMTKEERRAYYLDELLPLVRLNESS